MRSLDFKRRGFDLTEIGNVRKERTTDIKWDTDNQQWFIHFLTGKRAGTNYTMHDSLEFLKGLSDQDNLSEEGILLWDEYDDAVQEEIRIVQAMREADPELV